MPAQLSDGGTKIKVERNLSLERTGNRKTMMFCGDRLSLATIRGSGKISMQSLPWGRVLRHIIARGPAPLRTGRMLAAR